MTKVITVWPAGLVLYEDFEGTAPPAFSPGWLVVNHNGDSYTWKTLASGGISTGNPICAQYSYNSSSAADDWFFSPALTLQAGKPYKLDFFYKAGSSSWPEKLRVHFSTSQSPSDTLPRIWDNGNVINTSYALGTATFVPSTKGTYYLGFYCYSAADELTLYVDSIALYIPPPHMVVVPDSLVLPMNPDQVLDTSFFVSNSRGDNLTFSMAENPSAAWLGENPTSGTILPTKVDTIHLHLNATGYGLGTYRTVLEITSNSQRLGKGTNYFPVTMKLGGPILSVNPDSLHVGMCPPGSQEDLLIQTNTGNEPLEIYGVKVAQTSPKAVHFYMGTPTKDEVRQGKDDQLSSSKPSDSKRRMTSKAGGPDMFGHVWIDSDDPGGPTFAWIDISGTGTPILGFGDDTNLGPFPIGFNFNFYGNVYNSIRACSNGWFSFTSTSTAYSNYLLPSASAPENLLGIFWDDMNFATSGTAYYQTIGNKFIIEYKDAARYSTGELYTYEAILDGTCGTITYQYLSMQPGDLNSATIGIQNGLMNDGLTVAYNESYMHDNLAIRFQTNPLWVSLDPCNMTDTLAPGASDTVKVKFDSSPFTSGNFRGQVTFSSNQPGHFTKAVPVAMDILSAGLAVSPASITDTCQEGGVVQSSIHVSNSGSCPLTFSVGAGCAWVSVLPTGGSLNPGQGMDITVTEDCHNIWAGNYNCELRITSNDPSQQPYKVVNIYKHVGPDPNIVVSPDSFYLELFAGTAKDTSMNIGNTGNGHLMYAVSTEDFTPPKVGIPLLTEGFEGTWPPTGWSIIQNDYNTNYYPCWWSQQSVYYHTGAYSAGLWWDYYDQNEWLITPEFSVAGACTLTFWTYGYEGSTYGDHYYVKASTDGGSNWDVLFDLSTLTGNAWNYYNYPYHIALDAYAGKNVKLAWHAYAIGGLYWAWLIDDVSVMSYATPWLTVGPPTNGVVSPHTNAGIPVHFSTVGVNENNKYAHIFVASNDPDQSMTAVRAHVKIVGPNYSIAPPETLVINALESQLTDGHLTVSNVGGFGALFYKMTDPVAWLSEIPDTTQVAPNGTQDVVVRVDGNQLFAGDYSTKIAITTNDFHVPKDTIVVIVHMGPAPCIAVSPTAINVMVNAGSTKDTVVNIANACDGHLAYTISTEEGGPKLDAGVGLNTNRVYQIMEENRANHPQSAASSSATGTENARARLTGLVPKGGTSLLSPSSVPIVTPKGDTVFAQLPHDPTDLWSAGTSDQGAGYKIYENFWGVTKPVNEIKFWGLPLIYSGGWAQGNPNNIRFDISFYSDPPNDPTLPPAGLHLPERSASVRSGSNLLYLRRRHSVVCMGLDRSESDV
ncbi:MAG: choice-of-anchor J domain-containing protein [Candidatus Zixiibacteriota bacterium]